MVTQDLMTIKTISSYQLQLSTFQRLKYIFDVSVSKRCMNFNISITLILLFISSDTSLLVISFSYFIYYTFYASLFYNKISITALLNVFLFQISLLVQIISFTLHMLNITVIYYNKSELCKIKSYKVIFKVYRKSVASAKTDGRVPMDGPFIHW